MCAYVCMPVPVCISTYMHVYAWLQMCLNTFCNTWCFHHLLPSWLFCLLYIPLYNFCPNTFISAVYFKTICRVTFIYAIHRLYPKPVRNDFNKGIHYMCIVQNTNRLSPQSGNISLFDNMYRKLSSVKHLHGLVGFYSNLNRVKWAPLLTFFE